ncbi:hypothetical protein ZWY2020_039759 [Hordeum vulgare]|nr:hypothetical protein ZWY2020_039759 [Hordeum vulgare]
MKDVVTVTMTAGDVMARGPGARVGVIASGGVCLVRLVKRLAPHEREPRLEDRDHGSRDGRRHSPIPTPLAPAAIQQGSGSYNDVQTRATEMVAVEQPVGLATIVVARGRSRACQSSPRAARRRSMESLTLASSPPLSPTTVLSAPPTSKRGNRGSATLVAATANAALIELVSPPHCCGLWTRQQSLYGLRLRQHHR